MVPDDPAVATPVVPELQEPPPASLSVVVNPAHTEVVPVIDPGNGFIVRVAVL